MNDNFYKVIQKLQQPPYRVEMFEDPIVMGGIGEFGGEVLSGPMLVMLALHPQAASRYIVDQSLKGYPYLGLVLAVAQGQLGAGIGGELIHCLPKVVFWEVKGER